MFSNAVSAILPLASLADVQMGYAFRSRLEPDPAGDVAVIQMKDIDDANRVHPETATRVRLPGKDRHYLKPGDLLFRSRGRSNDSAIVPPGIGHAVLAAPMLRLRPSGILPEYLCWFLNAPLAQAQLNSQAKGTSVRMVSAEALKQLAVPVPPVARQEAIARVAALVHREEELLTEIARLRRRLLNHLLLESASEVPS